MFIGHFALGFAAKRAVPRVSLGLLFAAAQLPDILWPLFIALGVEHVRIDPGNTAFTPLDFVSYPYSHSLLFVVAWGLVLAALYRMGFGDNRASVILFFLVVSHWLLDFLTHRPDMPLYPGSERLGLGLWNSVTGTLILEFALYAAGVWIYTRVTHAKDGIGRWGFIAMAIILVGAYLAALGGPPPSVTAVWAITLAGVALILALSRWVDRHREGKLI